MKSKLITVIQIAEAIEFTRFKCPIADNLYTINQHIRESPCEHVLCTHCIFNGLNQPDNKRLEILFRDIKNES